MRQYPTKKLRSVLILSTFFLFFNGFGTSVFTGDAVLSRDANVESDLAGYKEGGLPLQT